MNIETDVSKLFDLIEVKDDPDWIQYSANLAKVRLSVSRSHTGGFSAVATTHASGWRYLKRIDTPSKDCALREAYEWADELGWT